MRLADLRDDVRREGFWVIALLLLISLPELTTMLPRVQADVGPITLYWKDVLSAALALLGLLRLARLGRPSPWGWLLWLLWGLSAVTLLWGVASFGVETGVNSFRGWFYAMAPLTYAVTVPRDWQRRDLLGAVPTLAVLAVACVVRFAQDGLLIRPGSDGDVSAFELRPVSAAGALLLLVALLAVLGGDRRPRGWEWLVPAALLLLLVLVQQRTVWFAVAAAAVAWVVAASVHQGLLRSIGRRGWAALAAVVVLGIAAVALVPPLRTSATDSDTFTWRIKQWRNGIDSMQGPVQWLIGRPRGSTRDQFWYEYNGKVVNITDSRLTTHSFYVDTLLTVGVVGLIAMVALIVAAGSMRRVHLWLSAAAMVALVVAILVYGVTYFLPAFAFLLVGMGMWGTARRAAPDAIPGPVTTPPPADHDLEDDAVGEDPDTASEPGDRADDEADSVPEDDAGSDDSVGARSAD